MLIKYTLNGIGILGRYPEYNAIIQCDDIDTYGFKKSSRKLEVTRLSDNEPFMSIQSI